MNSENSGSPIYGSQIRRQNRRKQVGVGTADRRQLPFQESLYGVPAPPLIGEVPAVQAVGFVEAMPTYNPQRILRIRRPWPLQPMAANGRR